MSSRTRSAGGRLRAALRAENPLQVAGVINACAALLAGQAGFRALYLSGAGVANASYGLPDLGLTSRENVLEDVRRITGATELPLLVDVDTGWGRAIQVARTAREMSKAGAAGMQLEDQVTAKRCGHRPNKRLIRAGEMIGKIKAAVDARTELGFVVMARTDAVQVEGLAAGIERAARYCAAGADMIFVEALTGLRDYREFVKAIPVPVLANLTEFGKTPLFTVRQMRAAGVRLVLYPLSAFRAMNAAAARVYRAIRNDGTQRRVVSGMQTREELYRLLGYKAAERAQDAAR